MHLLKNTLSLVVVILFILMAFGTQMSELPLNMEAKLNGDSTAVIFKNLEDFNLDSATIELIPFRQDTTSRFFDTLRFLVVTDLPINKSKTVAFSQFRTLGSLRPFTNFGVKPVSVSVSSIVPRKKCGCSLLCSRSGFFSQEFK